MFRHYTVVIIYFQKSATKLQQVKSLKMKNFGLLGDISRNEDLHPSEYTLGAVDKTLDRYT